MNVSEMKPGHWDSMVNTANPKTGKAHAFLGVSKKNGETYIHNFADKAALKSGGYRMMSLPEIHEISHQIFTSPDCDSAIFGSTRQALAGFVDAKKDKLALAKAATIYNLFFSVVKYLAYALLITYAVGRKIGNSQHTKQICSAEINQAERIQLMYAKIDGAISKIKAHAGDRFLTAESEALLRNMLTKTDEIPELFNQFADAVIEAKRLNLETLNKKNHVSGLDNPHNKKMLELMVSTALNCDEHIGQESDQALKLQIADFKLIIYQFSNTSGCPGSTQFHDDNFVFAYNKTKTDDILRLLKEGEKAKGIEQPITTHESRYLTFLLQDASLYDYEKLGWIEDNWNGLVNQPDLLEEKYPTSETKTRPLPQSGMRVYGVFLTFENDYSARLERLLKKMNDALFNNPKLKEAVLKIQREHGYFPRGNGDGEFTKAHWDYTSNESQAFIKGTRTIGLMDRDRSIKEFKVDLDLGPLGPLSDSQCREYFFFMQGIDNGDLSRWDYLRARTENSGDVEAAMALLSPRMTAKLDDIAGKLNIDRVPLIDRALLLDIAINYSYKVTKGIALLFANKEW